MDYNVIRKFPTTHVLIDDNINYLRGISTILPLKNNNIYRYFTEAKKALFWINNALDNNEKKSLVENSNTRNLNCRSIEVNINKIHHEIYSKCRFNTVSTIIVDYDMPNIDGLEFCRQIEDPHMQKILLTGFLGEKDARNALNKGWIDMFIPKGEESSEKMADLLSDADTNFFKNYNRLVWQALESTGENEILYSSTVRTFFQDIYNLNNAVEFYLLDPKGDYLLVDSNGKTLGVSIQDIKRQKDNLELAIELGVHDNLLQQLKSGHSVFCFNGESELPHGLEWENYIFPATVLDKDSGLIGVSNSSIFNNKAVNIKTFKKSLYESVCDGLQVLA